MSQSLSTRVKEALAEEFCRKHLEQLLGEITSETVRKEARAFFDSQRSELLGVVEDVGEGEDMGVVLATRYVEQKARWIQLNIQLQYQSILKGESNPVILCQAACLSFLLGQIEPLIDRKYLDSINDLLNQAITGGGEGRAA